MRKKQFQAVCSRIIPQLEGFCCKDWMLVAPHVDGLLRGFCCDTSGFNPSKFVVVAAVMPLYVPTKHIYFDFGFRLRDERGCEKWWDIDDPSLDSMLLQTIRQQGLPFLAKFSLLQDVPEAFRSFERPGIPHPLEAVAYSLIRVGRMAEAETCLNELLRSLDKSVAWHKPIEERAKLLLDAAAKSPDSPLQILAEWEAESTICLGI